MDDSKYESAVGVLAGMTSGIIFVVAVYAVTLALLPVSPNLVFAILGGAVGGAVSGLSASLIYSRARDRLPGGSSMRRALAIVAVFALPWGLFWLLVLPITVNVGSNGYTIFIHKLGMETPWLYVPVSSQQVTDLEDFFAVGAYFTSYLVVVLAWVLLFGLLLGYLWSKRIER